MTIDEIVAIAQHHAATNYRANGNLKSAIVPMEMMVALVDILGEHSTCGIQSRDVVKTYVGTQEWGVDFDNAIQSPEDLRVLLTMYLRACDIADERNKTKTSS